MRNLSTEFYRLQKITCYRLKHIYNRIIRLLHKSIFNDGWEKLARLQFIGYNEQYCAVHKQRFSSMCLNQRCQNYIGHRHTFHYCISKSLVGKSKLPCFLEMSVFTIWRIFDWNAHIILACHHVGVKKKVSSYCPHLNIYVRHSITIYS